MNDKPMINSKLMEILNDWDSDYIDKKQAHDQIIELLRECLEKRRINLNVYRMICSQCGQNYHSEDKGFNDCIPEAEKKIGGVI